MSWVLQNQLAELSNESLELVLLDAMNRIGSHMGLSEYPDENYISKQQSIINMVKDELERRRKTTQ